MSPSTSPGRTCERGAQALWVLPMHPNREERLVYIGIGTLILIIILLIILL